MSFVLITVLFVSGICSEVTLASDCIEGFMNYDLLERKASQIGSSGGVGALSSNTLSSDTYYVIPSLQFTCSGTISGFLLGIDVRVGNMFPALSLYHLSNGNNYNRVTGSTRTIELGASNFSVSGVYEYNLSNHLQFSIGDILGIYQPPSDQSVVQLYYRQETGKHLHIVSDENMVTIRNNPANREDDRGVLLHPITNDMSCIGAFISADEIKMEAKKITTVDDEYSSMERLYKDIKFTCDGYITHVIIGTKNLSSNLNPPEIRLWRRVNDTGYERSGQTIPLAYDAAIQDVSTPFLRWYNLSIPVSVQKEDVLGIFNHLPIGDADCLIYYQKYSGPINYYADLSETGDNHYPLVSVIYGDEATSMPTASSLSTQTSVKSLVSTENIASTTSMKSPVNSKNLASTKSLANTEGTKIQTTMESPVSTESQVKSTKSLGSSKYTSFPAGTPSLSISLATMESTVSKESQTKSTKSLGSSKYTSFQAGTSSLSISLAIMESPVSKESQVKNTRSLVSTNSLGSSSLFQTTTLSLSIESAASGSSIGIIAGSTITILIVAATVAGLIIAVYIFLWRRKNKMLNDGSSSNIEDSARGLTNMIYTGLPANDAEPGFKIDAVLNNHMNEDRGLTNMVYTGIPPNDAQPGFKIDVGLNNPVYEADGARALKPADYEPVISSIQDYNGHYEVVNDVKSTEALASTFSEYESCNTDSSCPLAQEYSDLESSEKKYFTEEPIYWEPESNTESIYQQLSGKGFIEIPREMISVSEQIGSGQFGTVHKGIWNTTKGSKEVAIKTLKSSATEKEEVKFLQEAAINGQFHHRNVVKLCGVVTVGHPTMIVLEFATNGDLRGFLVNMRPVPGELPDDSFPTMLNDFSYHVASGMKYLSRKKFVHRDLAARNILVGDGKICKIADFGLSVDLQDETYYTSHGNTIPLKWTAPEAINFRRYSTQSDVWSFGSVLYEIWSVGHRPFEQHTNQEYISLIESGHRLCPPPGCPEVIYKMMIQSWHPDASSRPTFDELQSMLEDSESFTSETNLKAYTGSVNTYSDVQKIY